MFNLVFFLKNNSELLVNFYVVLTFVCLLLSSGERFVLTRYAGPIATADGFLPPLAAEGGDTIVYIFVEFREFGVEHLEHLKKICI